MDRQWRWLDARSYGHDERRIDGLPERSMRKTRAAIAERHGKAGETGPDCVSLRYLGQKRYRRLSFQQNDTHVYISDG